MSGVTLADDVTLNSEKPGETSVLISMAETFANYERYIFCSPTRLKLYDLTLSVVQRNKMLITIFKKQEEQYIALCRQDSMVLVVWTSYQFYVS
ncbi:hypothetical protein DPMN_082797 [Dreissena polymorpha]|uniref:Uncharacterized protein n=1 Tax=Dreissena polymorpha TaxID=45954 RepID=A0A9D3YBH3_DREPO|nr:hypothetical protein DPMN_082797 [Dreissena polymorpha]